MLCLQLLFDLCHLLLILQFEFWTRFARRLAHGPRVTAVQPPHTCSGLNLRLLIQRSQTGRLDIAAAVKSLTIHRHTLRNHSRQRTLEIDHIVNRFHIGADGGVGPVADNLCDQFGQHVSWPDLDKYTEAVAVEVFDLFLKPDR